jgi:hypothetical protein
MYNFFNSNKVHLFPEGKPSAQEADARPRG